MLILIDDTTQHKLQAVRSRICPNTVVVAHSYYNGDIFFIEYISEQEYNDRKYSIALDKLPFEE